MISTETLAPQAIAQPKARLWTGRILLWLFTAFMTMDAAIHLARPAFAVEATKKVGLDPSLLLFLGVWEVIALALLLFPRFRALGALLLTAFFGGAVAMHIQSHTSPIMAALFATLLWISVVCLLPNVGQTLGLEK